MVEQQALSGRLTFGTFDLNSLVTAGYFDNFKCMILEHVLRIEFVSTSSEIALVAYSKTGIYTTVSPIKIQQ